MGRKNNLSQKTKLKQPAKTEPVALPPLSTEALEQMIIKGILLFFIAVIVYIPVMNGGYIYDDDQLLTENVAIKRGVGFFDKESWRGLKSIWYPESREISADYFPVTATSLWFEWRLWGNNDPQAFVPPEFKGIGAPGYHTTNILLHGICALLLWLVLMRLRVPGAWIASILWAVHPVGAESVAWISERKNTLSMLFFLWGMLEWIKFQDTERIKHYLYALLLILISMLAKTAIVMVPFVLMLHVWWKRGWTMKLDWRQAGYFAAAMLIYVLWGVTFYECHLHEYNYPDSKDIWFTWVMVVQAVLLGYLFVYIFQRLEKFWRLLLPFFGLSFVLGVTTSIFQNARAIGTEFIPIGGYFDRLAGACFALGFYFYKIFVPINLSLIYPQWHKTLPHEVQLIPGAIAVVVFVYAWMRRATWGRHALFGLGFFVIMLFPILGFMRMSYMRLTLVADHFQYTAMVGVIALTVAGLLQLRRMQPTVGPMLVVLAVGFTGVFSLLTWNRAIIFQEKEKVWKDTLKQYPDSWQAHSHMGAILYRRGDIDGALQHWEQSVKNAPYLYEVHNNYGLALVAKGRVAEGLQHYKTAVQIEADVPAVRMNYADTLRMAKMYPESIRQYQIMQQLQPKNPVVLLNMGVSYFMIGKIDDAIRCFEGALQIAPNYEDAKRNLEVAKRKKYVEVDLPPASGASTPQPVQGQSNLTAQKTSEDVPLSGKIIKVLKNGSLVALDDGHVAFVYGLGGRDDAPWKGRAFPAGSYKSENGETVDSFAMDKKTANALLSK